MILPLNTEDSLEACVISMLKKWIFTVNAKKITFWSLTNLHVVLTNLQSLETREWIKVIVKMKITISQSLWESPFLVQYNIRWNKDSILRKILLNLCKNIIISSLKRVKLIKIKQFWSLTQIKFTMIDLNFHKRRRYLNH